MKKLSRLESGSMNLIGSMKGHTDMTLNKITSESSVAIYMADHGKDL
jgi:hypothetical protein